MSEDPLFCEDCDMELTHDDVRTVRPVPRIDIETYEMASESAEVYQCDHCGMVIGYDVPAE